MASAVADLPTDLDQAREAARSADLDDIDVSAPELYERDVHAPFFERLRREAPVHRNRHGRWGPFWSVTRMQDIKWVDSNETLFSAQRDITIFDQPDDFELPMFIAMDPPGHDQQRADVTGVVAPRNLKALESTIRERAGRILDGLPVGQPFNWVDEVAVELTSQMLAILLGFPVEERARLRRWSDVMSGGVLSGTVRTREQRRAELLECLAVFTAIRDERARAQTPGNDLVSMLAHGEATRDMAPMEFLGNLMLLLVGGNDTTRNSISGGVLALNRYPEQFDLLRSRPELIPNMASEIIRWQTPLIHIRRTAVQDVELAGQHIRAGDKVLMWYISGNRDESEFDDAEALRIDRPNARHHTAFGFGIHRCMGNRLAEMQLRVLWEEILERFEHVEVVGPEVRVRSNLIRGIQALPVVVHPR